MKKNKSICILELGGTIGCTATSPTAEFYESSYNGIENILSSFSANQIDFELSCFFKTISHDITKTDLINLAIHLQGLINDHSFEGIIISMGTNALEDVAYFISIVIDTTIPIIFTGAIYPQNSLSSDGARNLYNAIKIVSSKKAVGLGVIVTFADLVVSAREISKVIPGVSNSFTMGSAAIGYVANGEFILKSKPIKQRINIPDFYINKINPDINIAVIFGHLGMSEAIVNAIIDAPINGIISAGFGKGYQPKGITACLKKAVDKGIIVVRCSRAQESYTNIDPKYDNINGFIPVNGLSANKASLLLFVALSFVKDKSTLLEIFGGL